jgi:thioredoxin-like negative regulator of GroEL
VAAGEFDRARRLAQSASELLVVAEALAQANRSAEVIDTIGEAVQRAPNNAALRKQYVGACLALGDVDRARKAARAMPELLAVADALEQRGDAAGARQIRTDAIRREPGDPALRARLIQDYYKAGDLEQVRWLLTPETAGDDPQLLRILARLELGAGRPDEARRALTAILAGGRDRRDEIIGLVRQLANEGQIEAAYVCAELLADTAAGVGDWSGAASGLQALVARAPRYVPGLMKLIEICVDGRLDSTMYAVQGQLADAYLAAGQGPEARLVAEDLVQRAPWHAANIERCRKALALAGDPTPDRTIANLLSADASLTLEDL